MQRSHDESYKDTGNIGVTSHNNGFIPAREKKILAYCNGGERRKSDDEGFQESDSEWKSIRSTPSEMINLKYSLNFECSNSIPINFAEAWSYFESCDMSPYLKKAEERQLTKSKLRDRMQGLIGSPSLNRSLNIERDLIFSIASCPMNNSSTVHSRILQSIYVFLTAKPSCPRYGNHWEEVGFQGQDPASDLRGVGMLGALQMLYLCSAQECKQNLACEVFKLSRHPEQQRGFPLAVLSLNITKIALDAFRDGLLNRFCNKERSAIAVLNRFYLAVLFRTYRKWKSQCVTIHESCFLLKAVEKWCRANPKKTLHQLDNYWSILGVVEKDKKRGILRSRKRTRLSKPIEAHSWFDLTKPSVEVFI